MKKVNYKLRYLLIICCMLFACDSQKSDIVDLNFENNTSFGEWVTSGAGYLFDIDTSIFADGERSFRISYVGENSAVYKGGFSGFASMSLFVNGELIRGKKIRLSLSARTSGVSKDCAMFGIQVSSVYHILSESIEYVQLDSTQQNINWHDHSLSTTIDSAAKQIEINISLCSQGQLWVDNIKLEIINSDSVVNILPKKELLTDEQKIQFINDNSTPFFSSNPNLYLENYNALANIAKDVKVIGLGEGTHGAKEFFQIKDKIIRLLVSKFRFTQIVAEITMPEAYQINTYILTGKGDPKNMVEHLSNYRLAPKEFVDLLYWLREFNIHNNNVVRFTGIDMQDPTNAQDIVREFLVNYDTSFCPTVSAFYEMSPASIISHIKKSKTTYLKRLSEKQYDSIYVNAIIYHQATFYKSDSATSSFRDSCMASNFIDYVDKQEESEKFVLWAHNLHINRLPRRMGAYIGTYFREQYFPIGLCFNTGSYLARDIHSMKNLTRHTSFSAISHSIEWYFHLAQEKIFFFNLKNIGNIPQSQFLDRPMFMRQIGDIGTKYSFFPTQLKRDYDALIFIDSINPSVVMH